MKPELKELFSTPLWLFDLNEVDETLLPKIRGDSSYYNLQEHENKFSFLEFPGYGTSKLKEYLIEAINDIAKDRNWPEFDFEVRSRHSLLKPGENDSPHHHADLQLVGVYYVHVPPNSGDILLFDGRGSVNRLWEDKHIGTDSKNRSGRVYHRNIPIPGTLVMFPSYVFHCVETNLSNENRVSIVFDIRVWALKETPI